MLDTPSPTMIFEAALRGVRGIHTADEPIEVESFVSDLLGNFDRPLIDIDDRDALWEVLDADGFK